jgi:hypothetical protein
LNFDFRILNGGSATALFSKGQRRLSSENWKSKIGNQK